MSDLKTSKLSGSPKSMREYRYHALVKRENPHVAGMLPSKFCLAYSDYSIFNRVGNITERTRLDAKSKLVHKNLFTYNESEKLVMHYMHESSGVSMKYLYHYDNKGACRGMDFYIYGFIPGCFHYYSEEKEGLTQAEVYDIEGELTEVTYYIKDEKGNLLDLKRCQADGKVIEHYISRYDNQNREMERTGLAMSFCNRMVIRFDNKENETEVICYGHDDRIEKHYVSEYNFDIHGNWIRKTVFLNGVMHELEEREFEYY